MDMPTQAKITVLRVDYHAIMRGGLRRLLELESDIAVVAEAGTGEHALAMVEQLHPHVIILDINLPNLNGLQVVSRLRSDRQLQEVGIILLTAYDDPDQEVHAMRSGASAYCPKAIEPDKLVDVVRQVAQGKFVIEGKVLDQHGVDAWLNLRIKGAVGLEDETIVPLSPREMEILRCVTRGLSNKIIAQELGISHQTVRNHMTSILNKLNVRGRTEAAIYALKRGWVRQQDYRPPADE